MGICSALSVLFSARCPLPSTSAVRIQHHTAPHQSELEKHVFLVVARSQQDESIAGGPPLAFLSVGHKGRSSSLCPENSTVPPNLLCSGSCLNLPWSHGDTLGHFTTHLPTASATIHLFPFPYTITMASILVNLYTALPEGVNQWTLQDKC